ncbi:MAG: hypothetical protein U0359_00480 [Byssovorax sp.]
MRRLGPSWLSRLLPAGMIALTLALGLGACATYRQDLARARAHYDANEYEKALALLRVLEPDQDSFGDAEKAQYAYTRGMTDYRLASLANPGGVSDPKREFRSNARHWLAVSMAIEKQTPGGLSSEEKDRLTTALEDLNHDVLGGADTDAGPAKPGDKPAEKPADKPGDAPPRKPN